MDGQSKPGTFIRPGSGGAVFAGLVAGLLLMSMVLLDGSSIDLDGLLTYAKTSGDRVSNSLNTGTEAPVVAGSASVSNSLNARPEAPVAVGRASVSNSLNTGTEAPVAAGSARTAIPAAVPPAPAAAAAQEARPEPGLPLQADCVVWGVRYEGGNAAAPSKEADVAACQDRCMWVPECKKFTFQKHDGKCQLHTDATKTIQNRGQSTGSGPKYCDSVGDPLTACHEHGAAYQGGLRAPPLSAFNALECQFRCLFTSGCAVFSYGLQSQVCQLHGAEAVRQDSVNGSVAGPRDCQPPVQRSEPVRCPEDLGPLPPEPELFNLEVCAQTYPAYVRYLERCFSLPRTEAQAATNWTRMRAFVRNYSITPEHLVHVVVKNGIHGAFKFNLQANGPSNVTLSKKCSGYKLCGVRTLLAGVVQRHGHLLYEELMALGGDVALVWRGADSDFPAQLKDPSDSTLQPGIPIHGYSTDSGHWDIAMPDFTFVLYPQIKSSRSNKSWVSDSWPDVSERLRSVSHVYEGFVYRGKPNTGSSRVQVQRMVRQGPPLPMRKLLRELVPDGFDVSVARIDHDYNGTFLSLYDQCKWAYTFHMGGQHYSAMLKYKMACGQAVFFVGGSDEAEFWYDALKHGENVIFLQTKNFWKSIRDAVDPEGTGSVLQAKQKLACIGAAGRRLVETYLSQHGIDCFVMLYLKRYYLPLLLKWWSK